MDEAMYRDAMLAFQMLLELIPRAKKAQAVHPACKVEVALKSMWRALAIAQSDAQAEDPK